MANAFIGYAVDDIQTEGGRCPLIIYFSATGNSKHVAHRIAEETDDWARSIEELRTDRTVEARSGGRFGIVCPTYFYGIPTIMDDFLKSVKMYIGENTYFYYVATYGDNAGMSAETVEDIMKQRGLRIDAKFGVRMPDSWAPVTDYRDKAKISAINAEADRALEDIIRHITAGDKGNFIKKKKSPFFAKFTYRVYDRARTTDKFTVSDACIGCKLCAKRCPLKIIKMVDGKPLWDAEQCTLCLGCYHRCPVNAIDYNKSTEGRGQYIHPEDTDETDKAQTGVR